MNDETPTPPQGSMPSENWADWFVRHLSRQRERERFGQMPSGPDEAIEHLNREMMQNAPTQPLRRDRLPFTDRFIFPSVLGLAGFVFGGGVLTIGEFLFFGGRLAANMPGGIIGCCIAAGLPVGAGTFYLARKSLRNG